MLRRGACFRMAERRDARGAFACGLARNAGRAIPRNSENEARDPKKGPGMTDVTIYHNPRCTKSRQTLELLRSKGIEPTVVEYLKTPPSAAELTAILGKLGKGPRDILRAKEAAEAGIAKDLDGDALVAALAANPAAIERPIVVKGDQARVGRPPESVLEIL